MKRYNLISILLLTCLHISICYGQEQLEVEGNILVSDLQGVGTRPVFVDPSGVLTTGAGSASKQITFTAGSIVESASLSVITPSFRALTWRHDFQEVGYITIKRPLDWDQISDVNIEIYFFSTDFMPASSGTVQFSVRPRDRNIGDTIIDEVGIGSTLVNITSKVQQKVVVTIPASRLEKEFWELGIQRESINSTFTGAVDVQNVTITYN